MARHPSRGARAFQGAGPLGIAISAREFYSTGQFSARCRRYLPLWSIPITTSATATKNDYANEAGRLLDNEVAPLASLLGKPIILAVSYPSASGAASGCIPNGAGNCLEFNALSRPNPDIPAASLSLQTQSDIYESMLVAVNARPWISGFVSRGFFIPVALQDKSTSIHGKPAGNVIWYWYRGFLGMP